MSVIQSASADSQQYTLETFIRVNIVEDGVVFLGLIFFIWSHAVEMRKTLW